MISAEHDAQLTQRGYAIVPRFLSGDALLSAQRAMLQYFPSADELAAAPQRFGFVFDDPEHLQVEFPFADDRLNDLSTHPAIISFVRKMLGTNDVLLSQSAIWAKYAGTGDFEQALHLDYQGNTLVVPRDDGAYRQINFILYYSDVPPDLGPTYVVNQQQTTDLPLWPTHRPRRKNAKLYELETPVLAAAGDLLIFSMRTWHRASAMLAETGARFSQHLVYRAAGHGFQGYHLWSRMGENEDLQRFIERSTIEQREVLGFPKVDDAYWNDETIDAVSRRYPKLDVSIYR